MWFDSGKIARAIESNGIKREWLYKRLGISATTLRLITSGQKAASYRVAKELLQVLGYDAVVKAIDWGRTSYASV